MFNRLSLVMGFLALVLAVAGCSACDVSGLLKSCHGAPSAQLLAPRL
jgi:hypothetical protein